MRTGEAVAGQGQAADLERTQPGQDAVGVHQGERLAADEARALERAAVRQHLGKTEIVADRAEQAVAAAQERFGGVDRVSCGYVQPLAEAVLLGLEGQFARRPRQLMSGRPYIAASRGRLAAGLSKLVSSLPSGSNRGSRRTVASGRPKTISRMRAATSVPALYCQRRPQMVGERKPRKIVDRLCE